MSAEHFVTTLEETVDTEKFGRVHVYVYAHDAIGRCADALRQQPMSGISGDMEKRRMHLADLLDCIADAVCEMAKDDAFDGELTPDEWYALVVNIQNEARALPG